MLARLTATETVVIKMLAAGNMPCEIADKLCRSGNTISTHLARIKRKIGARSTIQAAVMWATDCSNGDMEYLSWGKPTREPRR